MSNKNRPFFSHPLYNMGVDIDSRIAALNINKLPKPRALDLYSGAGGAGFGLLQGGFKTVVGVDIKPQPRYEHAKGMHFVQGDVTKISSKVLKKFDFVWASPPCQFASGIVTQAQRQQFQDKWQQEGRHINLIPKTRQLLRAGGVPSIIENVVGAKPHMRDPIRLCGTMFPKHDLRVFRMRLFEGVGLKHKLKQPMSHCNKQGFSLGDRAPKDVIIQPRTEKLRAGALPRMPAGFEAKPVEFPSRKGERIDHIYIPLTDERMQQTRKMFNRNYCRSVKEAMRAAGDLIPMTKSEQLADRMRYEDEVKGLREREKRVNPSGKAAIQMFPIYGDGKRRGSTEEWRTALNIPWMERHELRESIPPAYSEYLANQVLSM